MSDNTLAQRLDEVLTEAIEQKVKDWDFDSAIEQAFDDFNADRLVKKEIENQLENYDFDDDISEAVREFNFDQKAEMAVEEAINEADLDAKAHEAVTEALNEQLLPKVKEMVLDLLNDSGFLEKLTQALFETAV